MSFDFTAPVMNSIGLGVYDSRTMRMKISGDALSTQSACPKKKRRKKKAKGEAAAPPRPSSRTSLADGIVPVGARIPWAELLKRVYLEDVLACPCGGRRRIEAFIEEDEVVA